MDTKIPQSPSPPQCRAAQCSSVHSLMSLQKPQSSLWPTIVLVCQGPWASLAPQLQVINAVLEIKILNWASLEAAQQGLRYCLVSPRQPGWLPGLSGAAQSTCHELPTWGFVLSNGMVCYFLCQPGSVCCSRLPLPAEASWRLVTGLLSRSSVNIRQRRCRCFKKSTGCFVQTRLQLEHCSVLMAFHALIKPQLKEPEACGKSHLHQCKAGECINLLSVLLMLTSRLPIYYLS